MPPGRHRDVVLPPPPDVALPPLQDAAPSGCRAASAYGTPLPGRWPRELTEPDFFGCRQLLRLAAASFLAHAHAALPLLPTPTLGIVGSRRGFLSCVRRRESPSFFFLARDWSWRGGLDAGDPARKEGSLIFWCGERGARAPREANEWDVLYVREESARLKCVGKRAREHPGPPRSDVGRSLLDFLTGLRFHCRVNDCSGRFLVVEIEKRCAIHDMDAKRTAAMGFLGWNLDPTRLSSNHQGHQVMHAIS